MSIGEEQIATEAKFKSKRGRPRQDYSKYIDDEGPLGLKIQSIIGEGSRAREGPHVVALCPLCGETSGPRLRDVLSGHSQSGGCRKKECYLAFRERAVDRLDESKVAAVLAARFSGMSRQQAATQFNMPPPIVHRAQCRYQARLDAMIADGTAARIREHVSQPGWSIDGAASHFNLLPRVVWYLTAAAHNRAGPKRSLATKEHATAESSLIPTGSWPPSPPSDSDEAWLQTVTCCALLEHVLERREWSVARPGEFAPGELRRSKGKLVGAAAELYEWAKASAQDETIPLAYKEDLRRFTDVADASLANREARRRRMAREKMATKASANTTVERS